MVKKAEITEFNLMKPLKSKISNMNFQTSSGQESRNSMYRFRVGSRNYLEWVMGAGLNNYKILLLKKSYEYNYNK